MDEASTIAKHVEELVLYKFDAELKRLRRKAFLRKYPHGSLSESTISSVSSKDSDYESIILEEASDFTIDTENVAEAISEIPASDDFTIDTEHIYEMPSSDYHSSDKIFELQPQKTCFHDDCTGEKKTLCSAEILEAERILCLMHYNNNLMQDKENLVENELYDAFNPNTVTIKKLQLKIGNRDRSHRHYFFCLLRHCDVFYASTVSKMDSSGIVTFCGEFEFKRVQSDFNLTVFKCSIRKKKWWDSLKCCANSLDFNLPPKFHDWGQASIKAANLLETKDFKYPSIEIDVEGCEMSAEVVLRSSLNSNLTGVLDFSQQIGRSVLWKKTYAVIKGTKLMFYKYPRTAMPFAVLDLKNCILIKVVDALFKRRTLYLEFEQEGRVCGYYLAAENNDDFVCWKKYLNMVVGTLQKWQQIGFES